MECSSCDYLLKLDWKYCPGCGEEIPEHKIKTEKRRRERLKMARNIQHRYQLPHYIVVALMALAYGFLTPRSWQGGFGFFVLIALIFVYLRFYARDKINEKVWNEVDEEIPMDQT